ncbi:uncharacterized protein LOC102716505 [Oryza brachyantha]|uniref:Uncharacterized protein n=1 Tax=Oryza brachyantha TaxID=4533 RepID=J3M8P1_ORYBR|nr:uncharacterized protein LOC102716505 [Oryza brachyantha]
MGIRQRSHKLPRAMAYCRCRMILVLFFFCVCIFVATTDAAKGPRAAGRWTVGSPAAYSAGGPAGADVFRDSKRRIPKGPDPIHNRRAGKATIAPRRRD